jgi:hypothetical protein
MTTCYFCGREVKGSATVQSPPSPHVFHCLEDEYGNPAPKGIPSCWEKSAEGKLTLQEYLVELYADET